MFGRLFERYRQNAALKAWRRTPLGGALDSHVTRYFVNMPSLSGFSPENKEKIVGDFYSKVFAFETAPDKRLAVREALASYTCLCASMTVLSVTPEEKAQSDHLDTPYISAELRTHIQAASDVNKELKQLKWSHGSLSDNELIGYCNTRGALYNFYLNGFNLVRIDMDDRDSKRDWLKPFFRSMCIWEEHQYRQKLALPSLLSDVDALEHSVFLNMVVNGIPNPYYEWDTAFGSSAQVSPD